MTISFKKTKTQVFNDKELAKKDSLFSIGSEEIENVQSFTYFGHVITNSAEECFTDHRVARAVSKFNELRTVLCDSNINIRTKRKILEACVRSRLTYGIAAWFPNEFQIRKLEACWCRFLRSMVKGGWKRRNVPDTDELDGLQEIDYGFVYTNEQIQNILGVTPLQNFLYISSILHIYDEWRTRH